MIRIGPVDTRRVFTAEDIEELIPVLRRVSRRASRSAVKRANHYGKLRESEPEWAVLKHEMREIILAWSAQVSRLGAEPGELWTVGFRTSQGTQYWRYEPENDPADTQYSKSTATR